MSTLTFKSDAFDPFCGRTLLLSSYFAPSVLQPKLLQMRYTMEAHPLGGF